MKAYTNSDLLKAMYIVDKLYDIAGIYISATDIIEKCENEQELDFRYYPLCYNKW
ncbi:MAG: hypothetical protein IKS03_07035 [Ruminococcus sp.]|nr:hypothetical protein [Ruminococcus sp.]